MAVINKLQLKISFTIAAFISLQGCVSPAVTGMSTGAEAAYNHHNIQLAVQDQNNTILVDRAIHWYTKTYKDSNVSVSTFNDVLILTGQVPTLALRQELEATARNASEAKEMYNLTTVGNPVSPLIHMSDSWITTKIKSELIATSEIDPSKIKVITENGTVYLIGTVFPDQASIATDIARTTAGVQNVVRVFTYLEVTKDLNAATASAKALG
jgi:osmotically-inducible protein OsmY